MTSAAVDFRSRCVASSETGSSAILAARARCAAAAAFVACQRFGAGFATREALEATAFPGRAGLAASAGGNTNADAINTNWIFFKTIPSEAYAEIMGKNT